MNVFWPNGCAYVLLWTDAFLCIREEGCLFSTLWLITFNIHMWQGAQPYHPQTGHSCRVPWCAHSRGWGGRKYKMLPVWLQNRQVHLKFYAHVTAHSRYLRITKVLRRQHLGGASWRLALTNSLWPSMLAIKDIACKLGKATDLLKIWWAWCWADQGWLRPVAWMEAIPQTSIGGRDSTRTAITLGGE